ncbi:MAG TPA: class I SAM-dependent methyltransferase [Gaiellaceae bacterium]|jgi:predicted TPR repeat methyltransferase
MEDWGPETYGEKVADAYDEQVAALGLDTEVAVEALAELAGGGPVLELAIGTGRLGLPLAARGIEVHGIDASDAMVAKLREKPGGDAIPVTIGDFADVAVDGRYSLIFVGFNTFYALTTQADQVRCFANAAEHLADRGVFALEGFVPDLGRYDRDQRLQVNRISSGEVFIDAARHDQVSQRIEASHIYISEAGTKLYPVQLRYAWPSELDLMARLAGLELKHRWSSWRKEPFGSGSPRHVSVYGR